MNTQQLLNYPYGETQATQLPLSSEMWDLLLRPPEDESFTWPAGVPALSEEFRDLCYRLLRCTMT